MMACAKKHFHEEDILFVYFLCIVATVGASQLVAPPKLNNVTTRSTAPLSSSGPRCARIAGILWGPIADA